MTRIRFFLGILIATLLIQTAPGARAADNNSSGSPYSSVYQAILGDLGGDIQTFDGVSMSKADRDQLSAAWQAYVADPTRPNPLPQNQPAFQSLWPPKPLAPPPPPTTPATAKAPASFDTFAIPKVQDSDVSLLAPVQYASDRLGGNLSKLIQSHQVSVEIYGGTEQSLAQDSVGHQLQRIPSLYESWGVTKFLDVTPGQSIPKVVICVPPIEQYVHHYGLLTSILGGKIDEIKLNNSDRAAYRADLQSSVAALYSKLPKKPDYVILGYGQEFDKQLHSSSSPWVLEGEPQAVSASGGLSGTLYTAKSRIDPNTERSFLAVQDTRTLWGEGTAFLSEGFLQERPRGILFFGSAGATDPAEKVYGVTVPSDFYLGDEHVPIKNTLDTFQGSPGSTGSTGSNDTGVKYGVHHGNSPSPAAETLEMVQQDHQAGIATVDVEESRVAASVAQFNQEQNGNVLFGAANIVTDLPADPNKAAHNLDEIDPALKDEARALVVSSALSSLDQRSRWEEGADDIRKKAVISALPKVDPSLITIINGQGKVDANPTNKLSYYVFTANPRDPESKTLLIPMATSRFDPYNYSTDDWWNAHINEINQAKLNHTPMPHQDPKEVAAFLKANGLSENPDVLSIDSRTGQVGRRPLRDFLMQEYMSRFNDGTNVWLYRGADKADRLAQWKSGAFPHGVRYWTPDIDYGWRYGRINTQFLDLLVKDQAPVFKFAVPIADFKDLVDRGALILGTELTKHAHDSFAENHTFTDQLTGYDYLGEGKYGLEFELRGKKRARDQFSQYFRGAVTTDELAAGRIHDIQLTTARLALQRPEQAEQLMQIEAKRIARVQAERTVLDLVHDGADSKAIAAAVAKLPAGPSEIANIDGVDLATFATTYHSTPATPASIASPAAGCVVKELDGALASKP